MKTNYLFVCIFAIAAASIFSSCEKVITLDLKNSDPLYVIEDEYLPGDTSLNTSEFPALSDKTTTAPLTVGKVFTSLNLTDLVMFTE